MSLAAMVAAQAIEITRLQTQVRQLEEALAAQKVATSDALDREAKLLAYIERTTRYGQ